MDRFLKTADLRKLEKQVVKGEITYGKMIEQINFLAYKHYTCKQNKNIDLQESVHRIVTHLLNDKNRDVFTHNKWSNDEICEFIVQEIIVHKQDLQ